MKKYDLISADPPWAFNNKRTGGSLVSGSADQYPTFGVDVLCKVPVADIAAQNCVLALWGPVALRPETLQVMAAWGFKYKTSAAWVKTGANGLGFWFRNCFEDLLIGVRGKDVHPPRMQVKNWFESPRLGHSQKPLESYPLLEDIASRSLDRPKGELSKLDLFAAQHFEGWDACGLFKGAELRIVAGADGSLRFEKVDRDKED